MPFGRYWTRFALIRASRLVFQRKCFNGPRRPAHSGGKFEDVLEQIWRELLDGRAGVHHRVKRRGEDMQSPLVVRDSAAEERREPVELGLDWDAFLLQEHCVVNVIPDEIVSLDSWRRRTEQLSVIHLIVEITRGVLVHVCCEHSR